MSRHADLERASRIIEHINHADPTDPSSDGRSVRIIAAALCKEREDAYARAAEAFRRLAPAANSPSRDDPEIEQLCEVLRGK